MRETIDDFVANDYARVVAAVGIVTDEPALADEGVQSALTKVATNNKQYDAFAARVAIVATGEVRLIARRRMNEKLSGGPSSAPDNLPPALEQSAPIVDAIRQLSQRQREMALLHYYLGTSVSDIADVAYLNESTVETHIDQSRRAIAEYLVSAPSITEPATFTSEAPADVIDTRSQVDKPPATAVGEPE